MMPMKNTFLDVPATRGSVTFRPTFTGNVLGDFLLGYVSDTQLSNVAETHQELSGYAFYAQDDWKPSDKIRHGRTPALRYDVHDAAARSGQPHLNFDAGRRRAAASGDQRLGGEPARWWTRTATTSRRASA